MSPVIVLGGGGHAKVVIDALRCSGADIIGLCDPALEAGSEGPLGVVVEGGDEVLRRHPPDTVLLVNGIGSTRSTALRRSVYERHTAMRYRFATVIHPSAVVSEDARLEEGAQVMAGAVIQPGAVLEQNCIVNTRASVDHDCVIGAHAHVAPGVTLSGNVQVGAGAHVGTGASVIQGIRIGCDSLVGAGSVVVSDLPDRAKAVA